MTQYIIALSLSLLLLLLPSPTNADQLTTSDYTF